MTYITQLTWRKAMFSSQITTILLAGFVRVVLQNRKSAIGNWQWHSGAVARPSGRAKTQNRER
jgi:hypothetical protein